VPTEGGELDDRLGVVTIAGRLDHRSSAPRAMDGMVAATRPRSCAPGDAGPRLARWSRSFAR
jgi:hypothetical protein